MGQPVVVSRHGEQQVGEVVGTTTFAHGTCYEVSLEEVTLKGVLEHELRPVSAEMVRAVMGWLTNDAATPHAYDMDSLEALRDAALRESYLMQLNRGLAWLENMQGLPAVGTRHQRGDVVAVVDDKVVALGVVRGVSLVGGRASYVVESMGEAVLCDEDALHGLDDPDFVQGRFSLGERVRFVSAGHELDDGFLGHVCAVQGRGADARYAIMFDDGDILTELSESALDVAN